MKLKTLTALLMMFSVATANGKSIADNSELSTLMAVLSDSASGGASLAMFEFSEDFFVKDLGACKIISGEDATFETMDSFEAILDSGESRPADYKRLARNLKNIQNLFGDRDYYRCRRGESIFMGYNSYEMYIATDFSYRVAWITGHED